MLEIDEYRRLPLAALIPSKSAAQVERRAYFKKPALEELAQTIKKDGVHQAIVVRPFNSKDADTGQDRFEIVAGERRWLASKIAGIVDIPARVRSLSDEQAEELQLVENLQRESLNQLAEAQGYESMQKRGISPEDIAARCGVSVSTVFSRKKLLALIPQARAALYEGKIVASTALEIARIPPALQLEALTQITSIQRGADEAMSVRAAREYIHDHYLLRLSTAGFPPEDATLLPKAGACGLCPKRTGNQPQLFGDVKATDVCTDSLCFKAKIGAYANRLVQEAKQTGQKVIAGPAAVKKVAPHGLENKHAWLDGYVRLDDTSYDHDGKKYSAILGKDYVPTLLQNPDTGEVIKIAARQDIPKPKSVSSGSGRRSGSDSQRADNKAEKAKAELQGKVNWAVLQKVYEKTPATLSVELAARLCDDLIDSLYGEERERTLAMIGGLTDEARGSGLDKQLVKLPLAQLVRIITVVDLVNTTNMTGRMKPVQLDAAAKALKIDPAKVRAEITAAAKVAKAPATKPGKAKSSPKKKAKRK